MEVIREINNSEPIKRAGDVYKYLSEFKNEDREYFIVIGLDTKNKPCYREIASIGTLNASIIHPREIFKKAIMMSCNSIMIAHNHPSGDPEPSPEDIKITENIVEAGKTLQIKIVDHVIIGKEEYYSFEEYCKI